MANYNIDIAVAIKNAEKLRAFDKSVKSLSENIKNANFFIETFSKNNDGLVRSTGNLQRLLNEAASNMRGVALGTKEATIAAAAFVKAQENLNQGLREEAKLIKEIQEKRRLERFAQAGIRPGTQYKTPIGPGLTTGTKSSLAPGESLFGQSVNVEGRSLQILREEQALQEKLSQMQQRDNKLKGQSVNIEKRLQRILAEEKALQDGLLKLEQQSTKELEEKFLLRTKNREQLNNEIKQVKSLRQAEISEAVAQVERTKQQVATEIQINAGRRERMVMANQELQFEIKLNRILDQRRVKQRNQAAVSNAFIGGAFPLLFGQGLGASIGGAAGGFAGGKKGGQFGFAFSLLGTVLGSQLDRLAQSARELGEALRDPIKNLDLLTQKIGQANTPFGDTINTLKEFGLEAVAAEVVLDRFNKTFNTNRKSITEVGKESIRFQNELARLGTAITLLVAGPLSKMLATISDALGAVSMKTVDRRTRTAAYDKALEAFFPGQGLTAETTRDKIIDLRTFGKKVNGMSFDEYRKSLEQSLFPVIANESGLGGQTSDIFGVAPDFNEERLQALIKERRDFELLTLRNQLEIEKQSLTMRSEDLDVLKRRMDLVKIEEKLKVKGLADTKMMTAEQQRAHQFAIDKLEIEKQISKELLDQAIIMADPMKAALVDLNKEMEKLNDMRYQAVEFAKAFGGAFEESFKGIIKGTMTVQDAFRSMFMRIADHFLDMVAQMMATQISRGFLGMFGSTFGGGGTDLLSNSGLTAATPGEVTMADFNRANGGPVKSGNSYIVGERGPELFSPGVSGMITPNHALGGTTSVVVNVDASGTSVEGNQTNGEELGRLIGAVVQSELIKEKRPGGLLA